MGLCKYIYIYIDVRIYFVILLQLIHAIRGHREHGYMIAHWDYGRIMRYITI